MLLKPSIYWTLVFIAVKQLKGHLIIQVKLRHLILPD